ncbi:MULTISPECIES: YaiI/YqxD family protein [unclassified Rummeliibacillus]|uniref:YaiI/YqxD family protein n=1 Tax=unclassified Rummeliibacillus TaxID=2622809 RepID=UPI000E6704C3|nr:MULTISPECIES: YaiI/YqxD family protein [unclassified Rummeliibacillus]RIJ64274.1 YaiI/YqxD family protein [Rummeliibacillus sp. POC4]RPJ94762.1 YaiI/YqxD family protein [Rummeliibacillus sp. TYF005]
MSKICIDADGCPVVKEAIQIAKEFQLEVIIFCDTSHRFEIEGIKTVIVSKGADAVDFALVNQLQKGDISITQDYGLAAMVLAKGGYVMNQNGLQYTSENIDQLLYSRHINQKIRQAGGRTKGPKKRSKESNERFITNFRKLCDYVVTNIK